MIYDLLGTIGNLLFCWACITMAFATVKKGADIGTPLATMWTFFIANASFGAYLFGTFGVHILFATAVVEVACWALALRYHYWPRIRYATAEQIASVRECTREPGHTGACNGWPSKDCNVWCDALGKAIPLRDHPLRITD